MSSLLISKLLTLTAMIKSIFFQIIFLHTCIQMLVLSQSARLQAFPGAEGFGAWASGGRGGIVYEVTNLNDNGPGSFRAGTSMNVPRTIVFRISGTITRKQP